MSFHKYSIAVLMMIILNPVYGQIKQSHTIVISFLQMKEQFNLGMVFNGAQLEYLYGITWKIGDSEVQYQPKLSFGAGFNRGMIGYQIKISPINASWTMPVLNENGHTLKAGAHYTMDYGYQMYPDLHGGHLFWASEIGFSPIIQYSYQWNQTRIGFSAQNSLLGFVSHTQKNDPYFYSFKASDFFIHPHKDMQFGSFNKYNHTIIAVEYVPNVSKIHSFSYEFDYFETNYGIKYEDLNHSLLWKMSL
ncbi:hypothetical protein [Leadbettera azotonutricia]|uniref:Uncharacterized protein n=1 Tax=Leadbettera azotonutricia (strain ATCC BAA-888 / DSM 13862 / ZAS-9) TaxID=545695 RepID=F5Y8Q4_LEAAZ|nr:hypothetical protein [Leadbettera azotonutricia]AEF80968.1 hypothetical protein TREAZ_2202 [Leadbettera azotonutricia ZAS-9]